MIYDISSSDHRIDNDGWLIIIDSNFDQFLWYDGLANYLKLDNLLSV